jgi:hypothetical protein
MDSTPTISYAAAPCPEGLCVERDLHHVRVVVPPLQSWRSLGARHLATLALFFAALLGVIWSAIQANGAYAPHFVPGLVMLCIPCAILVGDVLKLHCSTSFTITADRFSITTRLGSQEHTRSWPIGQAVKVKRDISKNLVIVRISGRKLMEFAVSPDPSVTGLVADTLDQALHQGFHSLADDYANQAPQILA